MATIYNLVTQLSADPAPMAAGFARGTQLINAFVESANKSLSTTPRNALGQYTKFGSDAALAMLDSLEKTFNGQQATLKEALARGALSEDAFKQQGTKNALAFNTSLLNSLTQIDLTKAVPPETRIALVDALKETGIAGATALADPFKNVGTLLRSFGRDLTQTGRELSEALTAPIVAGAVSVLIAADTIKKALDQIAVSTGATGATLASLDQSFSSLFTTLPNSAGDIAKALTLISQISGATGANLEALATQALNLSRITGTDLTQAVTDSQRAFQAWGISTTAQGTNLDTLFKVSQQTGSTITDITGVLTRFAPSMQQFGLSFTQSAALIGQFQKTGIDAEQIFTTLQTSLSRFSEAGLTGAQGLSLLIEKIKEAATDSDAINIASKIFGPRQASQLALAIRDGKVNIDALTASVRASGNTINDAAKDFDPFNASLGLLRNQAAAAGESIGNTLQQSFIRIQPTLTAILSVIKSVADGFATLPQPLQDTIIVTAAFLAVAGPLLFILGGLSKGFGALSLAIGLVRNGLASLILSSLAGEATELATGVSAATGAVGLFATGLAALATVGVVVGVIAAIYAAFEHFTKDANDAKDALVDFTANVAVLNGKQLNIQTTTLRQQLLDVNDKIKALQSTIDGEVNAHKILGIGVLSGQEDQLKALQNSAELLGNKLGAVATAQDKIALSSSASTVQLKAFNDAVDGLITSASKGVTVDSDGVAHGSIKALTADLNALHDLQAKNVRIGKPDTAQFDQALQVVQTALTKAESVGKSLPDVLDPKVALLEKHIVGLVSAADALGQPFQQLSRLSLNDKLLTQFESLDKQVQALGDRTDLTAQKLRELAKQTGASQAVQIGTDVLKTGTFSVSVTGEITKIVPSTSLSASNNFIDLVNTGLKGIAEDAEKAGIATQNLNDAFASGNVAAISTAQAAYTRYYTKLQTDQAAFNKSVDKANVSLGQQRAAKLLVTQAITAGGADNSVALGLAVRAEEVKTFMQTLQKAIDAVPGLVIPLQTKVDLLALHDTATTVAQTIAAAQLQALAGNSSAAAGALDAITQQFAKRVKAAASAESGKSLQEQAIAYKAIADEAARAGVPIDKLNAAIALTTKTGQITALAAAFVTLTADIFGANSAIGTLASGFANALTSGLKLADTVKEIQASNTASGNTGGAFGGIFNSVQNAVKIVPVIGQAISAGIGLIKSIGSLFGESALQKEHDAILRSNNDALDKLRDSLDRQAGTPGLVDKITKAIAGATGLHSPLGNLFDPSQKQFTDYLNGLGLTFSQVNAQAKALGITLVDSKGNLVGFDAFKKALAEDAILLQTIGKDLSTQQELIKVTNALNGTATSPAQTLKDSVDAIAATLDSQGGKLGASLENALGQGPDALRAALKALLTAIEAGTIPLSQLGGLSASDLLNAIGGTADALNSLAGKANSATDALVNVPSGFKKALAEFNAQTAQTGPTVPTLPAPAPSAPTPPFTGAPGTEPNTPLTNGIQNLIDTLKGIFGGPAGKSISNPITAIPTAPSALSSLSTELTKLTQAGATSGTALSDVLQTLGIKLPAATDSASASLAQLIKDLASATVTAPAPTVPVRIPAPMFHVEASATVSLAAPSLRVQPFAPLALAAPTVTFSVEQARTITLAPPVVAVQPFTPITLDAPTIVVSAARPVEISAPVVAVQPAPPISLAAPLFSIAVTTQTLAVTPPLVRLSGSLAAVVVPPPPATITPYSRSVSLSPPAVSVSALSSVRLAAPTVTIPQAKPVTLAAPAVHVPSLASISLARPVVTIKPLAGLTLDAPKVAVKPLSSITLDAPKNINAPVFKLPADLTGTTDNSRLTDTNVARALMTLAASQQQATPVNDGAVHLHNPIINIDASKTPAPELFDLVKKQAQKLAHQKTGDSTRVVDAFSQ